MFSFQLANNDTEIKTRQLTFPSVTVLMVNFLVVVDFRMGVSPKMDSIAESRSCSSWRVLILRAATGAKRGNKRRAAAAPGAADRWTVVVTKARVSMVVVDLRNIVVVVKARARKKRILDDPRFSTI
jgi:hypothetical protein